MKNNQQGASEEMILYARVLERGMYAGLILMFVTFFIYLFGIIDPLIPSIRSLVATLVFVGSGMLTVFFSGGLQ